MNKVAKQSEDLYKEKIEQLKKIYPALFSDEGNLNEEELRAFLKQFASTSEGKYEFNWAGKMSAKRNAFTTSRAMLKPDKDRSIDFNNTENLIIEGDNLEVLKLLQKSYQGKIKCIYIDPPYNTGNDFIYTDNFSEDKKAYWEKSGTTQDGVKLDTNTESQGRYHSNWLNMIYPRLLIARNLLKEDGVIFLSIDDNELANARKIMDEIFGEENFIDNIIWKKRYGGGSKEKYLVSVHEYCLFYAKNIENIADIFVPLNEDSINRYYKGKDQNYDLRGPYRTHPLEAGKAMDARPNLIFPIIAPDGSQVLPKKQWLWSKERVEEALKEHSLEFIKTESGWSILTKQYLKEKDGSVRQAKVFSIIDNVYSQHGTNEMIKIMGNAKIFSYPKPTDLLKQLISVASSSEAEETFLDFFAGSGSLAQAVMELNREDNGNRKFILVQIPEKTDEVSEAFKAGYKKISDICIERVKRVSEKLAGEKVEGDLGFKVFTLSPSYFPENLFTPDPEKTEEENKKALAKYIEEASTQLEFKFDEFDLMYEVLLKDGFTLNFKAEKLPEFTKNNIYKVTDGEKHAYVTLDGDLKDETLQKLQSYTEERFICLERAVDTTKKWNLLNMFGSNLWVI